MAVGAQGVGENTRMSKNEGNKIASAVTVALRATDFNRYAFLLSSVARSATAT